MIITTVPERPVRPISAKLRYAKDYRLEHKLAKYEEAMQKYNDLLMEKGFVQRSFIGGPKMKKIIVSVGL